MIITTGDLYLYRRTDKRYTRVEVFQADETRATAIQRGYYAMPLMGSHVVFTAKINGKSVQDAHRQFHVRSLTRLTLYGDDRVDLTEEDHYYLIAYRKIKVV